MKLLSQSEFDATQDNPGRYEGAPAFEFWDYFDEIPEADFKGYDCSEGIVNDVYRMDNNLHEHVLVKATALNVFMVLVNDLSASTVYGHFLLNLNEAYSVKET